MKAAVRLLVLCFLLLPSGCAGPPKAYTPPVYSRGAVVAVWELENMSVESSPLLDEIGEMLTARVIDTLQQGGYVLIERQKLLLALEELNIGSSALAGERSRLEVGRIIGAQLMVFGGYQRVGEQLRIDLRMVEVETGAVVRTADKTTRAADVSGWLDAAASAAAGLL